MGAVVRGHCSLLGDVRIRRLGGGGAAGLGGLSPRYRGALSLTRQHRITLYCGEGYWYDFKHDFNEN